MKVIKKKGGPLGNSVYKALIDYSNRDSSYNRKLHYFVINDLTFYFILFYFYALSINFYYLALWLEKKSVVSQKKNFLITVTTTHSYKSEPFIRIENFKT